MAGQIENYLVKALMEYRSGERKNESMNIVAKQLTDEEIANTAAFYAALGSKCTKIWIAPSRLVPDV